jgi:hypothetical protein
MLNVVGLAIAFYAKIRIYSVDSLESADISWKSYCAFEFNFLYLEMFANSELPAFEFGVMSQWCET